MEVEQGIVELELKYCERCGGLWLRVRGKDDVYCTACAAQIAELSESMPKYGRRKSVRREEGVSRRLKVASRQGGNA